MQIFNTLTKKKEQFIPINENQINILEYIQTKSISKLDSFYMVTYHYLILLL